LLPAFHRADKRSAAGSLRKPQFLFILISLTFAAGPQAGETRNPHPADTLEMTLGTVVVVAKAPGPDAYNLPASVDVVAADKLENRNADFSLELAKQVPGVYASDYGQGIIHGDIGIRGFNAEGNVPPVKLLIDGIPANLNNGYPDMNAIFPLEISRMELVRGTNDPRYGLNNLAGNLNILTRRGGNRQMVKLSGGNFYTGDVQALSAIERNRLSQTYFAGYRRSDGYRENSGMDKYALSGKWFYTAAGDRLTYGLIARASELDAKAPGYLSQSQADADPRASPAFSKRDGGTQSNRHGSLHADWDIRNNLWWSFKTYAQGVERHRWVRFSEAGAQQERVEDEKQYGAISTLTWQPSALPLQDLILSWGTDYQLQDNVNQRFLGADRIRTDKVRDQLFYFWTYGSFLQADGRPKSWLRLIAALRWDRVDGDFTDRLSGGYAAINDYGNIWEPKFSAVITPYRGYNLYANWGRSFQVGVGAGAYGNNHLDWSKNTGWEAGVKAKPRTWLSSRISLWEQTATDEVRLKFDASGESENIGETRRNGWDAQIVADPISRLSVWAAYSRQFSELVEPGPRDSALQGNELDHLPGYTAKFGIDVHPMRNLTTSVSASLQDDYYLTTANTGDRFGDFFLLNLDLTYRLGKLTFGAHVNNLFDSYHEYVWNDGATTLHAPGTGTSYNGSFTWEY
jgi:iron complex outermembrane receptor protein